MRLLVLVLVMIWADSAAAQSCDLRKTFKTEILSRYFTPTRCTYADAGNLQRIECPHRDRSKTSHFAFLLQRVGELAIVYAFDDIGLPPGQWKPRGPQPTGSGVCGRKPSTWLLPGWVVPSVGAWGQF